MTLAAVDQNIISEIMQRAEELTALHDELKALKTRFNLNDVYNHTGENGGADLTAISTFAHLTQSEIGNAINAFQAIVDALDADANLDALYLMKG